MPHIEEQVSKSHSTTHKNKVEEAMQQESHLVGWAMKCRSGGQWPRCSGGHGLSFNWLRLSDLGFYVPNAVPLTSVFGQIFW